MQSSGQPGGAHPGVPTPARRPNAHPYRVTPRLHSHDSSAHIPARIRLIERIVAEVAVAVVVLCIDGALNNDIRLHESPQARVLSVLAHVDGEVGRYLCLIDKIHFACDAELVFAEANHRRRWRCLLPATVRLNLTYCARGNEWALS